MNKLLPILALLSLCVSLFAQGANPNAHRTIEKAWTSPDAVAACLTIEQHSRELTLTHSQLMTIHGINQRTANQLNAPTTTARRKSQPRRLIVGKPVDQRTLLGTQALQQIQQILTFRQRRQVLQAGWRY